MKEQLINRILHCMQDILQEEQIRELQGVLQSVLCVYHIEAEKQELKVTNDSWREDLEDYLASKALAGKSQETLKRYRYELSRLLSYINKETADITSGDISAYLRAYKCIRRVSNQTLKNVRSVYSSFFAWLRDRDRITRNPMLMVEEIKVEKRIRKPFTDEERERMFRKCTTLRDKAMVEFLYSTAVRVSELTSLSISDVQFASQDLLVVGKGSKERRVYLNDRSNMYLREYLQSRTDDNPALFVSQKSPYRRLSKTGIEDIIRRIGKLAGVSEAYPHRFRRTAATNALNRGMPVQEVAQMLGHEKLETTMIYCTIDQAMVQHHHKIYLSV